MSKRIKWTIETVKEKCREHGIECLEDKYVDNKIKMRFRCKCGNEYEARWDSVTTQEQWQCPECSGKAKWTIEKVKEECIENDIVCLEKEYVNANTKMRFKCKCGNIYEAPWNRVITQDQWQCPKCSTEKQKLDFNEIKDIFISAKIGAPKTPLFPKD